LSLFIFFIFLTWPGSTATALCSGETHVLFFINTINSYVYRFQYSGLCPIDANCCAKCFFTQSALAVKIFGFLCYKLNFGIFEKEMTRL